jgi:superfamily II DNA or RNA helicase
MNFKYDPKNEQLTLVEPTRTEYHQLQLHLTRYKKDYRFTPAYKNGYWNGKDNVFNNGKISLGLWKECLKACQTIGVKFNIINKEEFPIDREVTLELVNDFCKEFFKNHKYKSGNEWMPYMPYDHQIESAFKIIKNRFCLTEVATSGGKSLIISIVFFYILSKMNKDAKMLLIVPNISLVTQFYDDIINNYYGANNILNISDYVIEIELSDGEIHTFNPKEQINGDVAESLKEKDIVYNRKIKKIRKIKIDKEIRIVEIMSDKPRSFSLENPNVFIGTYQSLINYPKDFFKQFYMVVCDESHICVSKSLKSILSKTFTYAKLRFGVSGTFPTEDTMEILYIEQLMGPIIHNVSAKELIAKGIITQMDIKVAFLNHNDKEFNDKIAYIRKCGGGLQAYLIEKEYIHLSEKRINFIKKIVEKCNGNTLILFETIDYGTKLLEVLKNDMPDKNFYYVDGEVKSKDRNEIKSNLEEKSDIISVAICSFGTFSTGISVKNLEYLILADSSKSEKRIIQSIGRVLRLFEGKSVATIYDLVDIFEKDPKNAFYKHYLERQSFYEKREYPYKISKINL